MSWLPPAEFEAEAGRRPWTPTGVPRSTQSLSYVVVDEIVGNSVGLAISPWPEVDERGRLCFPARPVLAGASRMELEELLAEHREPRELAERPLRVGDVFAASDLEVVSGDPAAGQSVTHWSPPIYDVTAPARDAAKISLFGAVAPVLSPREANGIRDLVAGLEVLGGSPD